MRDKTKKLTKSAILLAVMMIFLYLRTIIPGYQLAFYFLASLVPGIVVIEYGIKEGAIFVAASFLLSLIMPIDKLSFLLFYSFFGIYGIVKFLIEKISFRAVILALKIVYFTAVFFLNIYFGAKIANIVPSIMLEYNIWIVLLVAITVFVLYDIMYTSFSAFYVNKIKRYIK